MQKTPGEHPGTPEINPVAGFSVRCPFIPEVNGKMPLVMLYVNGGVPPKACIWPL
jgi:hypothetical protein